MPKFDIPHTNIQSSDLWVKIKTINITRPQWIIAQGNSQIENLEEPEGNDIPSMKIMEGTEVAGVCRCCYKEGLG